MVVHGHFPLKRTEMVLFYAHRVKLRPNRGAQRESRADRLCGVHRPVSEGIYAR